MRADASKAQERKLTGEELVERTLNLLGRHARPGLPLAHAALRNLPVSELRGFDRFLKTHPAKSGRKKRPHKIPPAGKPHYDYKEKMRSYIEGSWGFKFESTAFLTISFLEAAANYLAGIYVPFGNAFAYSRKGILVMCPSGTEKTGLVEKFLAEEPRRAKLIADNNKSFVFAAGENRSVVFNEDQFDSLERRAGTPLKMMIHLELDMDTYHIEDIPYEQAVHDPEFNIPNGRIASSMQGVRFVKSGMVGPQVRLAYEGIPEDEIAALMSIAPMRVAYNPKDFHAFYLHMKKVILDRVA